MKKGDFVIYTASLGIRVRAIIRSMHRDGTATIEARHRLANDGSWCSGYLGHTYRLPTDVLTPTT